MTRKPACDYSSSADEEAPLLPSVKIVSGPTPLPMGQITVLLFLMLAEPITSQCIYPFINQLIGELDITGGDARKIGYYAGLIESLFFAAEALTILQWSRASDYVGRKPILLSGTAGLCLSMACFGLSHTFTGLVISRCLAGLLNGNIGVMKSMLGELSDETNMAQAFALIPVTWSVGVTLGPAIGGVLSRPHERFPEWFRGPFWKAYPYFLPCLVASMYAALSFVAALFFLKETVNTGMPWQRTPKHGRSDSHGILSPTSALSEDQPVPLRRLFTPRVVTSVTNYCLLAFLDISLAALLPLFYASPVHHGGLGLAPPTIGLFLAIFGISNGVLQAAFVPRIVERLGTKKTLLIGVACFIPVYLLFPVLNLVAMRYGMSPIVVSLVLVQLVVIVISNMAWSCIFIYMTSSAPNKCSLGATNGLAQTTVSFTRAVGPAVSTSLFAYSVERNLAGGYAVYVGLVALTVGAVVVGTKLPERPWSREKETGGC